MNLEIRICSWECVSKCFSVNVFLRSDSNLLLAHIIIIIISLLLFSFSQYNLKMLSVLKEVRYRILRIILAWSLFCLIRVYVAPHYYRTRLVFHFSLLSMFFVWS